jgi:hypothetical protein
VLQGLMGWPGVARVWLPAWLADPDAVVRDLVTRAQAFAQAPRTVGESAASTTWSTYEPAADGGIEEESGESTPHDPDPEPDTLSQPAEDSSRGGFSGSAYAESDFGPYPSSALDRLDSDPRVRDEVQRLMNEIIAESGPISVERLGRRVVKAYGRSRLVGDRLAQLRAAVPPSVRRDREEGFCWPPDRDPLNWTGFRASDDLKARPLSDIALLEIANAMASVAAQAMGIGTDDLFRQTYKLFGGNRLTDPARERMAAALQVGVARERLAVRGDVVTAL